MIKANFNAYSSYVTDNLYQWDINQILSVSGLNLSVAPEVHFSNANVDRAIVRQATMNNHVVSVGIPNSLLQDPLRIYAHIGIYEGSTFKVVELVEIPVIPRKRPTDYQIQGENEEIYSFKALENALNNKVSLSVYSGGLGALNARIDNIIAHNTNTSENTELVDMRTDVNGEVHASAGASVRSQIEKLRFNVADMAADVITFSPKLFQNGSWNHNDVISVSEVYRIMSSGAVYFPYLVKMEVANGFRWRGYLCDDNGVSHTILDWTSEPYVIPAYQRLKIVIARVEEDTSETADISEFLSNIRLYSALRLEIDAIDTSLKNFNAESFGFKPNIFLNGLIAGWEDGTFYHTPKYRIATPEIYTFDYDVIMRAVDGFRFALNLYEDGVFVSDEGWATEYIVPAGQQFKFMIARSTDDTNEVADVDEFASKVYAVSVVKSKLNSIDEFTDRISFLQPKHKEVYSVNHRGYNSVAPENTLPAFKLSKKNGFDFVETDVRWTKDNVPVLMHDSTINRTGRNADGSEIAEAVNIADITYAEALTYDFGVAKSEAYKGTLIPTFEEFITLCRNLGLHPYIEIEEEITSDQAAILLQIVSDCGLMDNVTWISFTYESLLRIAEIYPKARIGLNCITTNGLTINQLIYAERLMKIGGNVFFHADVNSINKCVEMAKAEGLALELWCPNTEEEIINLPAYISGVTTDKLIAKDVLYNAFIN